jgi:Zn-dependent alcohol dehydrogenase
MRRCRPQGKVPNKKEKACAKNKRRIFMRMKAAVCREAGRPVNVEEVELAAPKEREVLVKTAYCGFCHSDLNAINGTSPSPMPVVIGHEASGVIVDTGPGVTTLKKGDHVVGTWLIACGHCPECRSGWLHLCRASTEARRTGNLLDLTSRLSDAKGETLMHSGYISGMAEYMVLPEEAAIKIREDMPLDQACFLGCCMPTGFGAVTNVAEIKPGQSAAIWGMGGVGLNAVQGCKMRGANPIIAVDLEGSKETIAREVGATHFINSSKEDPVPIIQKLTDGGARFCFEVTGDPGAVVQAFWSLAPKGKLIPIGAPGPDETAALPMFFLGHHCNTIEGTVYGNISPQDDIPVFVDMVMRGDYKLDKLIGKKFKLEAINEVVDAMTKRQVSGRWVCAFD